MPSSIQNDPDALHEYRNKISNAIEKLRNDYQRTGTVIETAYSDGWKDSQFEQFRKNFSEDKERVEQLCKVLDRYEDDILRQLEEKMREYLGVDMFF